MPTPRADAGHARRTSHDGPLEHEDVHRTARLSLGGGSDDHTFRFGAFDRAGNRRPLVSNIVLRFSGPVTVVA